VVGHCAAALVIEVVDAAMAVPEVVAVAEVADG